MSTGHPVMPRLSVIVPCRNERRHIERFLAGLWRQQPVPGGFEVIVADGGSNDGTRDVLAVAAAREPRLQVIDNPAGTVSPGLNAAIRAARGEVVARMDVHTTYADDYLATCVATLDRTGAANVGGPARTLAEGHVARAIAAAYASPFAVGGARFHDPGHTGDVDTVPYGCWRRETLLEAGGFDEQLVRNQDDELNLRLRRRGGRIWQSPEIRSWYHPRGSLPALFRQYQQYGFWKVYVIRKHRMPASWRHVVPGLAVAAGLLLAMVAPWAEPAALLLAGAVGAWLALALLAAAAAAARAGDLRLIPLLPVVFAIYHVAYGTGFLRGLWSLRSGERGTARGMAELTR
jgi:glycosyltransferase involved in cell wall biosynthesis